jgi:hypothetical protein
MIRRTFLASALTLCAAAAALSACSDDPEVIPCDRTAGPSTITGDLAVHYQASATIGGALTAIIYASDTGNVTVTSPSLPWEVDVNLATAAASIQGIGSVTGSGSVLVEFTADGGEGRTESDNDGCILNVN